MSMSTSSVYYSTYGSTDNSVAEESLPDDVVVDNPAPQPLRAADRSMFKDIKNAWKNRKFETFFYFLCCLSGQLLVCAICHCKNVHNQKYSWWHKGASVLSWFLCAFFLLVNLGSLAFNMYVIGYCPYKNCTYFCSQYYESRDLLDAYLIWSHHESIEDVNNNDVDMELQAGIQPETDFQYNNWNKLLITTATLSGFLSYYMMIFFVIIPVYSNMCHLEKANAKPKIKKCLKLICTSLHSAFDKNYDKVISPFLDNSNDEQSSELSLDQKCFFLLFYLLNLLFWGASLAVFLKLIMLPSLKNVIEPEKAINKSGLWCQFLSQFCAIQSCFIFSKVAYGISNKCNTLIKRIKSIDVSDEVIRYYLYHHPVNGAMVNQDNENRNQHWEEFCQEIGYRLLQQSDVLKFNTKIFQNGNYGELTLEKKEFTDQARFHLLKKIDENFNNECNASIAPYSHWFAVHWFLYSLTSFMAMAFLTETYIRYIYRDDQKTKWWHADKEEWHSFLYIVLFCITHVFLFMYPCFRAALLTSSRAKAIKKFINHKWIYLSPSLQSAFYNHMKAQDFGFKISIFCSEITFGFNLAFVSVFIGMFGIIIKLSL